MASLHWSEESPNRNRFDGDCCTGPPSLGPPNPIRRLAGVRIAATVVVSSASESTTAAIVIALEVEAETTPAAPPEHTAAPEVDTLDDRGRCPWIFTAFEKLFPELTPPGFRIAFRDQLAAIPNLLL